MDRERPEGEALILEGGGRIDDRSLSTFIFPQI